MAGKKAFPRVNTRPGNMAREKQCSGVYMSEWAWAPPRCSHTGKSVPAWRSLLLNYPAEKDLFHALSTPGIGLHLPSPEITVRQWLVLNSHCRITQPVPNQPFETSRKGGLRNAFQSTCTIALTDTP